jgi:hypothetical protein
LKTLETFFKSSNTYEIPDLLLRNIIETPPALTTPFAAWNSVAKKSNFTGTWHFYVDDYRFTGLLTSPDDLILTPAQSAVECNFSITNETPEVVALYRIYQKRWLARYWQQERPGIDLWVDIAIGGGHREKAFIGVPRGWQRYSTQAREVDVYELEEDLEKVVYHSAGNPYTLLVYGGSEVVREWCRQKQNVVYMKHRNIGDYRPGEGTRRRMEREAMEKLGYGKRIKEEDYE